MTDPDDPVDLGAARHHIDRARTKLGVLTEALDQGDRLVEELIAAREEIARLRVQVNRLHVRVCELRGAGGSGPTRSLTPSNERAPDGRVVYMADPPDQGHRAFVMADLPGAECWERARLEDGVWRPSRVYRVLKDEGYCVDPYRAGST